MIKVTFKDLEKSILAKDIVIALMMLTSLIHGDDCLDDIEKEF